MSGGGLSAVSLPSDQCSRPLSLPHCAVGLGDGFSLSGFQTYVLSPVTSFEDLHSISQNISYLWALHQTKCNVSLYAQHTQILFPSPGGIYRRTLKNGW